MSSSKLLVAKGNRRYGFHVAFHATFPEVYEFLAGNDDFREFRIYCRGVDDFLAVLKGIDSGGRGTIGFASGTDAFACFVAAEVVIGQARWQEDRPQGHKDS